MSKESWIYLFAGIGILGYLIFVMVISDMGSIHSTLNTVLISVWVLFVVLGSIGILRRRRKK